jgi:hypothetical protein
MLPGCIVLREILDSEKSYTQFLRKQEKKEIPLKELSKENVKTFVQALRRKVAGGNITEDEI